MSITVAELDFLTSDAGARVLDRLAGEDLGDDYTLRLIESLRRDLPRDQAGAALELARLRQKAVGKFGADAARLYFTRDALEQASDPLIRRWRAAQVPDAQRIVDACCGIGADSVTFAEAGHDVIGLELDPLRVALARLNAAALDVAARFEVADVRAGIPDADLVFFDPARRGDDGKRIFDVERYQPPLSTLRGWGVNRMMVKLSPGVDLSQLAGYGGSVTFVSVQGDLKEAILMLGGDVDAGYRALRLGAGDPALWARAADDATTAPISPPRGWLVEPDPAIIRAGLVAHLALELGGAQLDPEIAYITTDVKPETVWARAWRIVDWMPFNLKKLRAYLREHGVGQVTVKKRGTAVTPETLIAKLKLDQTKNGSRTIVLTRLGGEHVMLICEPLTIEGGG